MIFSKSRNLQHRNLLRDKLRGKMVIRATALFNLQRNNVARQVVRKCCPYYLTFTQLKQLRRRRQREHEERIRIRVAKQQLLNILHLTHLTSGNKSDEVKNSANSLFKCCFRCCRHLGCLSFLFCPSNTCIKPLSACKLLGLENLSYMNLSEW